MYTSAATEQRGRGFLTACSLTIPDVEGVRRSRIVVLHVGILPGRKVS